MQEITQEKRHYFRIPISLTVRYSIQGETTKLTKETVSKNISQNGILFSTEEPLPIATKLNLEIIAPKLIKPIVAEGKVVRIEEIKENKLLEIGIAFTKIKEKDSQFIQQYIQNVDLNKILSLAVKNNASDIHLSANQPPIMRVSGTLIPMQTQSLNPDEIKGLIYGCLTEQQIEQFESELDLDTSYMTDFGRFRVNIHKERGRWGAVFRCIPTEIKTIQELGLPPILEELAQKPNGLILVTGPTGSGKSTTLAAMIEIINKKSGRIIISLEDPIEYIHKSKKSIIKQREIGLDSKSFIEALKHALRQDVDVILVGEMRDLESISIALIAAESGHLVLSTLNTSDTILSINRIIDIFPANQQQQVRLQLTECLRGIISQILIPRQDKKGRVVATEVLIGTPVVSNLIRQNHVEQLQTAIQVGTKYGMHLMDTSIERLYAEGIISRETALLYAKNQSKFL